MEGLWLGGTRVHACTITPRSSSAVVQWTTAAGQTKSPYDAVRTGFNDWLRAGAPVDATTRAAIGAAGSVGCPYVATVVELADAVESARNSGVWKVGPVLYSGTVTAGDTGASGQTFSDAAMVGAANNAYNGRMVLFKTGANAGRAVQVAGSGTGTLTHYAIASAIAVGDAFDVVDVYTIDGTHPTKAGYDLLAGAYDASRFAPSVY